MMFRLGPRSSRSSGGAWRLAASASIRGSCAWMPAEAARGDRLPPYGQIRRDPGSDQKALHAVAAFSPSRSVSLVVITRQVRLSREQQRHRMSATCCAVFPDTTHAVP